MSVRPSKKPDGKPRESNKVKKEREAKKKDLERNYSFPSKKELGDTESESTSPATKEEVEIAIVTLYRGFNIIPRTPCGGQVFGTDIDSGCDCDLSIRGFEQQMSRIRIPYSRLHAFLNPLISEYKSFCNGNICTSELSNDIKECIPRTSNKTLARQKSSEALSEHIRYYSELNQDRYYDGLISDLMNVLLERGESLSSEKAVETCNESVSPSVSQSVSPSVSPSEIKIFLDESEWNDWLEPDSVPVSDRDSVPVSDRDSVPVSDPVSDPVSVPVSDRDSVPVSDPVSVPVSDPVSEYILDTQPDFTKYSKIVFDDYAAISNGESELSNRYENVSNELITNEDHG